MDQDELDIYLDLAREADLNGDVKTADILDKMIREAALPLPPLPPGAKNVTRRRITKIPGKGSSEKPTGTETFESVTGAPGAPITSTGVGGQNIVGSIVGLVPALEKAGFVADPSATVRTTNTGYTVINPDGKSRFIKKTTVEREVGTSISATAAGAQSGSSAVGLTGGVNITINMTPAVENTARRRRQEGEPATPRKKKERDKEDADAVEPTIVPDIVNAPPAQRRAKWKAWQKWLAGAGLIGVIPIIAALIPDVDRPDSEPTPTGPTPTSGGAEFQTDAQPRAERARTGTPSVPDSVLLAWLKGKKIKTFNGVPVFKPSTTLKELYGWAFAERGANFANSLNAMLRAEPYGISGSTAQFGNTNYDLI